MHELRKSNHFRVIIGHININYVRRKFEPLKEMIKDNIDILLVSEIKLDDTFLVGQFFIDVFSFFKIGFTPCKAEKSLQSMELQKKKKRSTKR